MIKRVIISLFIVGVFTLLSFFISAYAEYDYDINAFDELEFEEYLAIIAAIAETEGHAHYLAINSQRYEDFQEKNPTMPYDVVLALVNVNADREAYSDLQMVPDPYETTLLVNKSFFLPEYWEPSDFVDIGAGHLLREEAAEHFAKLRDAIGEDNLNLVIIITYRSYSSQRNHFNNAVARLGRANAEGGNARPGHSEHQTGLAVDVMHRAHDGGLMMEMRFENSRQFDWLVENAHKYGFILRYPRGYRIHHGFMFEPWHWRYVGIPIATMMYNEEIPTYEEFYGKYLIQGVRDKVNLYINEQRMLAEEAEAAALAEAEAAELAAIEAAEAEAAAIAAAEASELAAIEAAALAAKVNETKTVLTATASKITASMTYHHETTYATRHFIEGIATLSILTAVLILHITRKRK